MIVEFARAGRRPREPPQPLPADLRRHPRLLEGRLDRVEGAAAARALRAHRRVPRDRRGRPAARARADRGARRGAPARRRATELQSARRRTRQDRGLLRRHAAALLRGRTRPRQIARHALVVMAFDPGKRMNTAVREMRGGFSEFICWRRATCTGSTRRGRRARRGRASTSSARTSTPRKQGLALEVYRVSTPPRRRGGAPARLGGAAPASSRRCSAGEKSHRGPAARPPAAPRLAAAGLARAAERRDRQRGVGLLHGRRRDGGRPTRAAPRPGAHDRRPRPRDLRVEGHDDPRPGRRHLLREGRASAARWPMPTRLERLRRDLLAAAEGPPRDG